jgi:hypothetical protein
MEALYMGLYRCSPALNHRNTSPMYKKWPNCLRNNLIIRGIYLPYIGFFGVLHLSKGPRKPYYPLAALIVENTGASCPGYLASEV